MRSNQQWGFVSATTRSEGREGDISVPLEALECSPEGMPCTFVINGERFEVQGRPIPWIDREQWWQATSQPVAARSIIDRPRWRLQAITADGELVQGDLLGRSTTTIHE